MHSFTACIIKDVSLKKVEKFFFSFFDKKKVLCPFNSVIAHDTWTNPIALEKNVQWVLQWKWVLREVHVNRKAEVEHTAVNA